MALVVANQAQVPQNFAQLLANPRIPDQERWRILGEFMDRGLDEVQNLRNKVKTLENDRDKGLNEIQALRNNLNQMHTRYAEEKAQNVKEKAQKEVARLNKEISTAKGGRIALLVLGSLTLPIGVAMLVGAECGLRPKIDKLKLRKVIVEEFPEAVAESWVMQKAKNIYQDYHMRCIPPHDPQYDYYNEYDPENGRLLHEPLINDDEGNDIERHREWEQNREAFNAEYRFRYDFKIRVANRYLNNEKEALKAEVRARLYV